MQRLVSTPHIKEALIATLSSAFIIDAHYKMQARSNQLKNCKIYVKNIK